MGIRSTIDEHVEKGLRTGGDDHDLAIKTWRYLRVGLIAVAIGLAVSVGREASRVDCFQTSISAYYYTPAQGVVVGALVAIGVCLICLRGASDGEDALLNFAGLCAPFVALVPTPNKNQDCGKVLVATSDRLLYVGNNVTALFAVAWLALAFLAVLTVRRTANAGSPRPSTVDLRGFRAIVAVLLLANVVFVVDRDLFLGNAHHAAAILLFVLVFCNVRLNAFQRYAAEDDAGLDPGRFNRYSVITVAMAADVFVHVVLILLDWSHWILTIEASLIAMFVWFWVAQTHERWEDGISPVPSARRTADNRA